MIVSPEARAELDRTCLIGRGWWGDDWWPQATAGDLIAVESHSWDHNHDTLAQTAQQLDDVLDEHRAGGFVCAAALVTPEGGEHVEHGEVRGTIGREPRGTNGFGYDPVLVVEGGRTLAEHTDAEKNAISHRGKALRAIAPKVVDVLTA